MLYALWCFNDEAEVSAWSKAEDDEVMARLGAVQQPLLDAGKLGPVARLMPTTAATTVRKTAGEPIVLDGLFAETKEQFLGFYVLEADSLDEVVEIVRKLIAANRGPGGYEIRPIRYFSEGTFDGDDPK